jgi:hypothetical protein
VFYIQKEKLDLWTTIPQQYTVTVLIVEDSALRYTSWFRAGSLQKNSQTVAPSAAKVSRPLVSFITGHTEAYGIHAVKFSGHNPSVTKSGQYREGESKRRERAVARIGPEQYQITGVRTGLASGQTRSQRILKVTKQRRQERRKQLADRQTTDAVLISVQW